MSQRAIARTRSRRPSAPCVSHQVEREKDPRHEPERPERDEDEEGDEAPETPPTEPEPVPVKEPPDAPGTRGPYVVD
jgi:hypothetical protein